jgi:hypothetical protein
MLGRDIHDTAQVSRRQSLRLLLIEHDEPFARAVSGMLDHAQEIWAKWSRCRRWRRLASSPRGVRRHLAGVLHARRCGTGQHRGAAGRCPAYPDHRARRGGRRNHRGGGGPRRRAGLSGQGAAHPQLAVALDPLHDRTARGGNRVDRTGGEVSQHLRPSGGGDFPDDAGGALSAGEHGAGAHLRLQQSGGIDDQRDGHRGTALRTTGPARGIPAHHGRARHDHGL